MSIDDVIQLGGQGFLHFFGNSLHRALQSTLPEYYHPLSSPSDTSTATPALSSAFSSSPSSKSQRKLLHVLKQTLHPNYTQLIRQNYKEPRLLYKNSKQCMEFDIYLGGGLEIAFEYHGIHHYSNHYLYGDATVQKEKVI